MKNREKFKEELVKAFRNVKTCGFVKSKVFPIYLDEPEYDGSYCEYVECEHCAKIFAFWLDEEYIEPQKPEVDWSKVPVDTIAVITELDRIRMTGGWTYASFAARELTEMGAKMTGGVTTAKKDPVTAR